MLNLPMTSNFSAKKISPIFPHLCSSIEIMLKIYRRPDDYMDNNNKIGHVSYLRSLSSIIRYDIIKKMIRPVTFTNEKSYFKSNYEKVSFYVRRKYEFTDHSVVVRRLVG